MKDYSQNNKNIWILNHYAITPDMPGGTRHYDFGKELIKRNYKISIFASSFHHGQHKEIKLNNNQKYKIENIDGINFVWIKTFPYQKNDWQRVINMFSYTWRVFWLGRRITKINKNIEKPDVIIGSSVHLLAVLAAYWLSKHYKAKFIMEVRDLWPQTIVDMGRLKKGSLIIKILRFLEKYLYQKARKIIVLMPKAEEYITLLGIEKNKIEWISNGVDISRFCKADKKKEKIENFKVMYFGSHGIANALDIILKSAKIIQNKKYEEIKFIFFGDGTEKKNLIKYKDKLKLRNAEFRESVAKKNVPAILVKADVLAISQKKSVLYKYGFSYNKLFDFMAAAKPIIFAGNSANDPVMEGMCGISVPSENSEKIAEAVIELYKMAPEERERMGKRGREYVEKYHSIPVLVDKLEKVLN